ncbi:glycosyltransferase family 2 protein [Tissierella creatinini]|nr:glycosyltransferase family 2 protein [Tissierella creatinini]TJX61064.1 glycosyltransferase family 2 protein [Soehngenia saccharolytica]
MRTPKVSIIIPFYSELEWLFEAVESVFEQTYENYEVIIINDGSKVDISEFLKLYKDKIIYLYQENKGAAAARNAGIEVSTGEYIAFLDSDDLWDGNKLNIQIREMIEQNAAWSHTSYTRFGVNTKQTTVNICKFHGKIFPMCLNSSPLATPCIIIRADILKKNTEMRFATDMKTGQDSYLWLLLALKYDIYAINRPLTMVRMRGTNSALRAYSQIRARAQLYSKINSEMLFDVKKELSLIQRFAYSFCVMGYKLLCFLTQSKLGKNNLIEFLSKVFYSIPWLCFKILNKMNR